MQKILGTLILCLLYCSTNFASEIKPFNKSGFIFNDGGKIKYIEGYKILKKNEWFFKVHWPGDPNMPCLLYTSPSPRD